VVERTFAWLNRDRRLAKDFERTIASAGAFLYAASVVPHEFPAAYKLAKGWHGTAVEQAT
jgi:hypothetical protein